VLSWVSRRLARRAGFIALVSTAIGSTGFQLVLPLFDAERIGWGTWAASTTGAALCAGVVTSLVVDWTIGTRLGVLTGFLESQAQQHNELRRLPALGDDEVGRAARATNDLLRAMTTVRVSMIDQALELQATQRELKLTEQLAAKTGELEARLNERALLFELLQASTQATALSGVLESLVSRLGSELRLREVAILVREDQDTFAIRAVHGFQNPDAVLGRSIRPGDGIAGEVARSWEPVIVPDVSRSPEYLAFWGEVPREGSFAAIPIRHGNQHLGILAVTRPPDLPLAELEVHFLRAVADTMTLAIQHGRLVDELRDLSMHDELTGLANRRLLQTRLAMELERAKRFNHPLSALVIDIDHFKQLNDRCGHATGDDALKAVARTLVSGVRRVDTVARVGGEEFVVLLARANVQTATAVAEKLRDLMESQSLPGGEGQPGGKLTVSLGVAELAPSDDAHTLIARADEALYLAKQRGRNHVAVFASPDASGPHLHTPGAASPST